VFLAALAEGATVTATAKKAGVDRSTAKRARQRNPKFAERWEDAWEQGTDVLEAEAIRRARDGAERPVWYQGAQVGVAREYSGRLLELLLKGRRPHVDRERIASMCQARSSMRTTWRGGGPSGKTRSSLRRLSHWPKRSGAQRSRRRV
jgi:hypothetical protein